MQWGDVLALLVGALFVVFVLKSITGNWRKSDEGTALHGKLTEAKQWLESSGYDIVRIRERSEFVGYYDGQAFKKNLTADFIVKKGSRHYAVKVANVREPGGLSGARMREHWFPLYVAFAVDGILHVDVDGEKVHTVDFDFKAPSYTVWKRVLNRCLWFIGGAVAALAWLHGR